MGYGDQANRLTALLVAGLHHHRAQHVEARQQRSSRAAEQMRLTWDEKVEKQPTVTELRSMKKKKTGEKGGEGKKVGITALGGGRKMSSVEWHAQSVLTRQEPLSRLLKIVQQGANRDAESLTQTLL